ncbi:serine/threonine kinase [Aureococcus anophagefferens]|nr:serine/threonine kinase [Aureococcus anophagefferens]
MDLKKNFWRASIDATSIYECILDGSCKGGANSSCARGHKGPLCGACEAHYFYDTAANRCVDCGNKIEARGDNIIGTVLAVLFVGACLVVAMRKFGFFTVLGHGVETIRAVIHGGIKGDAAEMVLREKLEEYYEHDEDGEGAGSDTHSAEDDEASGRAMKQNVMTKAKIVIATYQIACSIPWSLPQVRFPAIFEEALKLGSVVNLSFISFAKTECFGQFNYFRKLLFVTLLPVVFVTLIAVGFGLRYACVDRSRRGAILSRASYWVLFTLYVLVPSTSSYCLRYFACAKYDGGYGDGVNVLRIDPTISCDSPSYEAWLPYVLFSILAYPVGVPLGFACLLWRLRRRLNPDVRPQTVRTPSGRTIGEAGAHAANQEDEDFLHEALERHAESMVQFQKLEARANDPTLESMRFLYEEFKPSCFMFMVYEVSRRIFLTGCLSMFVPDSISQIAIGLLGSLISYRVFSHYEPYVEEDDGVVSEVAQTELVLVFFYAMMVFATDNLGQHDGVFSGKVFASLLVVLLASTLLVAVWLIIVANFSGDDLRSCSRNSRRGVLDVRRSLSGLVTPRSPKEGGGGDVPVEAGAVEAEPIARI